MSCPSAALLTALYDSYVKWAGPCAAFARSPENRYLGRMFKPVEFCRGAWRLTRSTGSLLIQRMCNLYYADFWIMPTIGSKRALAAAIAALESA
jgi:hypothetical protein